MINEKQFNAIPEKERMNRTLEGIAYYASVHTPNRTAEKKFNAAPAYIVYVGLEGEELAKAESYGLKILEPTNNIPQKHVKIQSKIKPKDGKTAEERFGDTKPDVLDSMQNTIPEDIKIGNGSKILIKFMTFWHQMSNQHGAGTWINKVQVKKLVKFEGSKDQSLDMDEDGYTVGDTDVETITADKVNEPIEKVASKKANKVEKVLEGQVTLDASIFDE